MLIHVLALGGGLFGLLGAGVLAIEAGAVPGLNVTIDTPATSVTLGTPTPAASAGPLLPSATPAPTATPRAETTTSPAARAPANPTTAAPDRITAMEDEVTSLINQERTKAGCQTVRTDERMRTAGRAHSADMAKNNYFSHTGLDGSSFVDRLARAGYPRSGAAGENIAYGYRTAADVVNGWMNSEGHRNNILNCSAKTTGVGLAYRGNTPYWTQLFGRT